MIKDSKVHLCDACGHPVPGHHEDENRPATLAGLVGASTGQGIMGTVDVPTGYGTVVETRPWYAHRLACLRKAIENVINDIRPPVYGDTEHEQ